jgi:hypothetical protein
MLAPFQGFTGGFCSWKEKLTHKLTITRTSRNPHKVIDPSLITSYGVIDARFMFVARLCCYNHMLFQERKRFGSSPIIGEISPPCREGASAGRSFRKGRFAPLARRPEGRP